MTDIDRTGLNEVFAALLDGELETAREMLDTIIERNSLNAAVARAVTGLEAAGCRVRVITRGEAT